MQFCCWRYIDTRVDELFPRTKNNLRLLKLQSIMEHVKGNVTTDHKLFADKQSEFSWMKPSKGMQLATFLLYLLNWMMRCGKI
ncbi:hypothetical protein LXL04_021331 [Taraxacum kok-saghyz]